MNCARLFSLALVALIAGCGSDDPPPPTGPIDFAVLRYDYAFDVESRAAAAAVTFRVETGGDCLTIPARITELAELTLDDEPIASGTLENDLLTVCGRGWEPGSEIALRGLTTIPDETWGDSQVGWSVTTDLEGQPFYYLVSWVGGCSRFGPCDDAPDRFAHYRFTVTHPAGYRALCPGTITAGETETICDFALPGGPTYSSFGVAISPSWTVSELGDWGGVQATLYDMPSSGIADAIDADYHAGFLAWMVDHFGPYPYGSELRFFAGPTYWNGFEHPGNISLNDQLPVVQNSRYSDPLGHTTNHEIAHMWAGDQTTLAGLYDFVWKEAMAEYLSFVYDEEEHDAGVARASAAAWKFFSRFAEYYPVPAEQPALLDYYGDVYGPGPMVLFRQIEALTSRDEVFAALAMLLGSERAIGVADIQAALEAATGEELGGYFDAWVYGEGAPAYPVFKVELADAGGGDVDVTVTQENAGDVGLMGAAFAVELTGDGGESHEVWVDMGVAGSASQTVRATPGFAVTNWRFDARGHTLGTEGARNAAPTQRFNPWVAPRRR